MAESKRSEIVLRRDKMETHRRVRSALMNGWFAGSTMMTYLLSYNTVMLRLLAGRFDCDAPFGILFAFARAKALGLGLVGKLYWSPGALAGRLGGLLGYVRMYVRT